MSWLMACRTLLTMWLMSERWYRVAWSSSLASQIGWAWIGVQSGLPGMVFLSLSMAVVAIRALLKLRSL